MAPVALQQLNVSHPYDFRVAIYTQASVFDYRRGIATDRAVGNDWSPSRDLFVHSRVAM